MLLKISFADLQTLQRLYGGQNISRVKFSLKMYRMITNIGETYIWRIAIKLQSAKCSH